MPFAKRNNMTISGFPVEINRTVFRMSETVTLGASALGFRMPFGMELVELPRIHLWVPQSSGDIITVDINQTPLSDDKASILSTPITIDNGFDWSPSASTPGVLSEGTLRDGALIEIDVDQVGAGTAQGMDVTFIGYRTGISEIIRTVFAAATTITSGASALSFVMPFSMKLAELPRARVWTPQASGNILTFDINQNAASILSTKLTIDNTETKSSTAATQGVLSEDTLQAGATITIDVDQVGDGTAEGLDVVFIGYRT